MICHLSEQVTACVASVYAVVAVGIYKLTEILVGLHESLAILECVLRVDIVIGKSMAYQQLAVQLLSACYGAFAVSVGILLWCAHETLGV